MSPVTNILSEYLLNSFDDEYYNETIRKNILLLKEIG